MPTNGGIIGPENIPVKIKSATALATTAFTSNGTLNSNANTEVADILVVGGGGGGSSESGQPYGGGGGAGGLLKVQEVALAAGSPFSVTIGAGGGQNSNGSDTTFANPVFPMVADGGGKGAADAGSAGGSGGCGGPAADAGGAGNSPASRFGGPQGNPGGAGSPQPNSPVASGGGGGGGSGGAGAAGSGNAGGGGGSGTDMTPFFGAAPQPVYGPTNGIYASGGGSSTYYGNNATPGGGGAGWDRQAGAAGGPNGTGANMNDGVANTGGGGGAGPGGDGGSGIVIVAEYSKPLKVSGMWKMNDVYEYETDNTWPSE